MQTSPLPPASTTPAFLSTGRIFGVSARAAFAPSRPVSNTLTASVSPSFTALRAYSDAVRITVRIVPSVGFMTALYAEELPCSSAEAIAAPSASSRPLSPLEIPRNMSERITPELPLAPRSRPEATQLATAETLSLSSLTLTSREALVMVMDIFVPVSPSGTGKTLSASISWR